MNNETVSYAKTLIRDSEAACGKKCKITARRLIQRFQKILDSKCADASYGVDDALNDVYIEFVIKKRFRPFTKTLVEVLSNQGRIEKDDDGTWGSTLPDMEEVWGKSNDDDLQGEEITANNMSSVVSVDIGPGSDAHIASIDIGDLFGEDYRTIFECLMAGEQEIPISNLTGLSRDQVKYRRRSIERYCRRMEHTLAPVNIRLGSIMWFMGHQYSFPSARKQQERIAQSGGHNTNDWVDHRGTYYSDSEKPDFTSPVPPYGDEIPNTGFGYEMNLGVEHLHLYT